ncbi:MAG: hypothetical protein QM783_02395 [Phycisphaerales bacterium]
MNRGGADRSSEELEKRIAEVARLAGAGKLGDAASRAGRLMKEGVRDTRVFAAAAEGALERRRWAEAEPVLRAWVELAPNDPGGLINLAWCLNELGREVEAEPFARRAVEIAPEHESSWSNLLLSLRRQQRWKSGLEAFASAPEGVKGRQNILLLAGELHLGAGDAEGALACAVSAQRTDLNLYWPSEAAAFASNYVEMEPARRAALHRNFGRLLEESVQGKHLPPVVRGAGGRVDRPLRVGFISHDLRAHPVGTFCRPLFEAWDHGAMELLAYSTHRGDEVSAHLRSLCDRWTVIAGESAQGAANIIRRHGVDVLVDLHGLTEGHRLATLALKPAPVQVTWCGYPNTTGMGSVDCRFVDGVTDPPGAESLSAERLVRLGGCFLCYAPPWGMALPAVRAARRATAVRSRSVRST